MSYTIIQKTGTHVWIKISNLFTVQDLLGLQGSLEADLQRSSHIRILIELENFEGWSHDSGWESTSFLPESDNKTSRIALVGDEKWKDEFFMFIGYPLTPIDVAYFPTTQLREAAVWLSKN
ncbi:STAS/SEC14 domain-containing protein [Methylomonas koyamae]|uniref:STAS/SEC14 domain-containing protein n=1 Tax=Methylomonas koyamae TaxID=702114 RepID=A0AA91DCE6_9GAMM|nr:STAS/SEC14 domain-containing protein [Methylomonas koyamae]OAI25784.1 hypothetical protein A1356_12900 [Methylomonas koyamae]